MIKIDGSHGESGGQILRTALAFSMLTGGAFTIENIRKGRETPGLKAQHLAGVQSAARLCNAHVEGAELGSTHLSFAPKPLKGSSLSIDIGTAGSATLLLQSLLPALIFYKKCSITVTGGTDVAHAPPYDYFAYVFLPLLSRFAYIKSQLIKRGYYPKGSGTLKLDILPKYQLSQFPGFNELRTHVQKEAPGFKLLNQSQLVHIKGVSHASADLQQAQVAERQKQAAVHALSKYSCPVSIRVEYARTASTGSGITLWALFSEKKDELDPLRIPRLAGDALGERGIPAEKVGNLAAQRLSAEIESKAAVDRYLADQLLPFMAFVPSKIKTSEITKHCLSNIYVIESFLGKTFEIEEKERVIRTVF
ncbi:RNA 3'-terminal phosphate cyclase [Candidatus Woesearchaeota archaeon]|nr:RNA 3'-terminal phosphate cyclase [Candidatus Woesearchaeota archaeon]